MSWRITYTDGTTELTPDDVDAVRVTGDGNLLYALSTRTYGPDVVVATYSLANVRKWEKAQDTP